jgi:hypothetical protein
MVVDKTIKIWLDDILQATTYVDIPVLSVTGVGHPEGTEAFASQQTDLLDGTIYQNTQYMRRTPIVRTARLTPTQIQNINTWWAASDQELIFEDDGVKVARGQDRYEVTWGDGFRYSKFVILPLRERRVWLTAPTRWAYYLS